MTAAMERFTILLRADVPLAMKRRPPRSPLEAFSFSGLQLVLLVARKRLGLVKRLLAGEHIRPRPPTGHVIPVEISGWPSVRKADFKTAALRNAFVRDYADAIGHASLKRGRANRQWPSIIGSSATLAESPLK